MVWYMHEEFVICVSNFNQKIMVCFQLQQDSNIAMFK